MNRVRFSMQETLPEFLLVFVIPLFIIVFITAKVVDYEEFFAVIAFASIIVGGLWFHDKTQTIFRKNLGIYYNGHPFLYADLAFMSGVICIAMIAVIAVAVRLGLTPQPAGGASELSKNLHTMLVWGLWIGFGFYLISLLTTIYGREIVYRRTVRRIRSLYNQVRSSTVLLAPAPRDFSDFAKNVRAKYRFWVYLDRDENRRRTRPTFALLRAKDKSPHTLEVVHEMGLSNAFPVGSKVDHTAVLAVNLYFLPPEFVEKNLFGLWLLAQASLMEP